MYRLTDKNRFSITRPELCKEWVYEKNLPLTTDSVSYGSDKKVWWKCSTCSSEWEATISNRSCGKHRSGCPSCTGNTVSDKNRLSIVCPEVLHEWSKSRNTGISPSETSCGGGKMVWWVCRDCGCEYEMSPNDKVGRGLGCPACRKNSKIITDKNRLSTLFPEIASEWHCSRNKKTPDRVAYGSTKKYWWICKTCKNEYKMSCNNRTNRNKYSGCRLCAAGTVSRVSQRWLGRLGIAPENREVSLTCGGKRIRVDGYGPETNTVYEFLGDIFHGNPNVCDMGEDNPITGVPYSALFDETIERLFLLRRNGYNLNIVWEEDFRKQEVYDGSYS